MLAQQWPEPRAGVGTVLPVTPSVLVEDFFGNPVPGASVTFSVLTGLGSVGTRNATTNAQGIATAGNWTLGTRSGDQLLGASTNNVQSLSFRAVADPGPFAQMEAVGPLVQEGAPRAPTPASPSVRTVDQYGNPVGDVLVTFSPGAGSGTVSATTVASDPGTGIASVQWTLSGATQQSLSARAPAPATTTATFTATTFASDFDISVRFVGGGGTTQQRDAFANAVVRWRRILTQHMHDTRLEAPAGRCASWIPALNETARDIVIFARITPIDGVGGTLAQAFVCSLNGGTNLTATGVMEFDSADLVSLAADGTLNDVVLHEVGHVLGIGTLWSFQRTLLTGRGTSDPFFIGESARAQFLANGGNAYAGTPVPVENSGGPGTRDSHWRRTFFGRELMQGYSSPGLSPLSVTTAASLTDLGYLGVRLEAADAFRLGTSAFYASPASYRDLGNDIMDGVRYIIDRNGNWIPVPK
jgi:hypothetical protein